MHFNPEPMSKKFEESLHYLGMIYSDANKVVDPDKPLPENKIQAYYAKIIYLLGAWASSFDPNISRYFDAIWHLDDKAFENFQTIYQANQRKMDCLVFFKIPDYYRDDKTQDVAVTLLKKLNSPLLLELSKRSSLYNDFCIDLGTTSSFSKSDHLAVIELQKLIPYLPLEVICAWLQYLILVGTVYPLVEKDYSEANRRYLCEIATIDEVVLKAVDADVSSCHHAHYQCPTSPGFAEELLLDMGPQNNTDLRKYKKTLANSRRVFLHKYKTIIDKYNLKKRVMSVYKSSKYWDGM